ncbi:uncharacterized protein LOC120332937 isoform X2 [Styela clava]|uniref:uncharacterized protein LOC120332937 isoform X2 n=1 Tax=Styela clava TaxID=7725 RepID=UPI001939AE27|nr:uncharacterized protein LOC120332937 isoform X2 [Styela clava]XP_039256509.1 uncharacterized protein LOC120333203 isoform X2 [Styela clava]
MAIHKTSLTVLISLLGLSFLTARKLPSADELDVSKLIGTTWYVGLQTNDPVASYLTCAKLSNFKKTKTGFQYNSTDHGKSSTVAEITAHFNRQRAGIYRLNKHLDESAIIADHKSDAGMLYNSAAHTMDQQVLFGDNFLIVSDYKNYYGSIQRCNDGGEWCVWGFFQSTNPTLKNVAAFYNKLAQHGISAILHVSLCSEQEHSSI